jgi:hypothetical protein
VAKLSSKEVRTLIDTERDRVLEELQGLARKEAARKAKELARREKFRVRVQALLVEGKDIGVPITDMAQAIGVTRQMAHSWLRQSNGNGAKHDE